LKVFKFNIENLVYILFVTLSFTGVHFFKIGMAEFTIFHLMFVFVIFFKFFIALKTNKIKIKIPSHLLAATVFLSLVNIVYYPNIKTTSFLFSLIIISEIVLIYNYVKFFSVEQIIKIVKIIILVYFINLVISSFFISISYRPTGLLREIFQIYYFAGRIRPYGFANEPSYAAIILTFTLFVLFKSQNFRYQKKEFIWYAMAVISVLITGSSYGYILMGMLLSYFILKSNIIFIQIAAVLRSNIFTKKQYVVVALVSIAFFVISFNFVNPQRNKSIQRIVALYASITSSEKDAFGTIQDIVYVDGSASMRLVPSIMLIKDFSKCSWKYVLFGRGAGRSIGFFSRIYEGNTTVLGFIPAFVYNYGILGTLLFFLFFLALFPKRKFLLMLLFLLFIFNADFNTQIFIYVLFTIMAIKKIELENKNLKPTIDPKD
jgi:hypothetical protein